MGGNRLILIFFTVVVFSLVLLAIQGLYWYALSRREQREQELSELLGTARREEITSLIKMDPRQRKSLRQAGDSILGNMNDLLLQAGQPFDLTGLWTRIGIFALVGAVVGAFSLGPLGLCGIVMGYFPLARLKGQIEERALLLAEQLPDALDLLARSLQAGQGIGEAMRVAAEELSPPISTEFGRVYEENNLGLDFREALERLLLRNRSSFDLKIFVSSVLLQRDTGGNLIEILENISNTVRSRFVFQGKVKAMTAEARLTAYILGGLPFFVTGAILAVRPTYLDPLLHDPLGNMMLGYTIFSFILGVFVMKEISKVEV